MVLFLHCNLLTLEGFMLSTGGIFILSAIIWGILVDKKNPDRYEVIGSLTSILGAIIIFYAPR